MPQSERVSFARFLPLPGARLHTEEDSMFRSFKVLCSLVFGFLLFTFIATSIGRAQPNSAAGSGTVKVMTYNVNEGSDFVEVLSATNFVEFVAGAQATLNEVTSSNPPVRMRAIAHQIGITQPDLVGLQEISTWYQGPFDSPSVQYDMLQELLDAMAQQGLHYRVVVQVPEFQLAGPLDLSMANWLFVNDYDVMLARSDKGDMQISNVQWANFNTLLPVPTPIGPVQILRGWGSADVQLHGRAFRFIVTHLENYISAAPATLLIQEAQAKEINDGPAYVNMPVIIAGDFNADALGGDPTIATHQEMLSFGFADAWASLHPKVPGPTWQLVDTSPVDTAFQRIDYIFYSAASWRPLTCTLAGDAPHDKVDGLWPSDHIGVRAELQFAR
jgi:endonuclease/exonuclease/phosphatase family metal-dependent hydrolase